MTIGRRVHQSVDRAVLFQPVNQRWVRNTQLSGDRPPTHTRTPKNQSPRKLRVEQLLILHSPTALILGWRNDLQMAAGRTGCRFPPDTRRGEAEVIQFHSIGDRPDVQLEQRATGELGMRQAVLDKAADGVTLLVE